MEYLEFLPIAAMAMVILSEINVLFVCTLY